MHHSGVEHDFESPLMKAYHAREPLPEDDPHVIAIRESRERRDKENAELLASDDLAHLQKMEWSMGNGQCPVCCGCKPGFHGSGGVLTSGFDGKSEWQSLYDAYPGLKETEGHEPDCPLAHRLRTLYSG